MSGKWLHIYACLENTALRQLMLFLLSQVLLGGSVERIEIIVLAPVQGPTDDEMVQRHASKSANHVGNRYVCRLLTLWRKGRKQWLHLRWVATFSSNKESGTVLQESTNQRS